MSRFMTFVTALAFSLFPLANTSVAVKRWGVPLPSCTDFTPFVYAGCFTDPPSVGALSYRTDLDFNNMTIEACVDFCKGNDYRYAGLEYYGECFCGATVAGALVDDSNCGAPCTGNSTEICGGNQYISIYQDPTFPPVNNSTISDYVPQGCYSEGVGGRALEYQQNLDGSTLTVEECLFSCKDNGFAFAGVEYASQCFCSVVLGNGTVPLDSSQCNMACNGDPSEMCGGSGTLNLYVAADLESSEPCGSNTTSSSSSVPPSSTPPSSTPPSSTPPSSTPPTSTPPSSTPPTSTPPSSTPPTSTPPSSTPPSSTPPSSTPPSSTPPTSTPPTSTPPTSTPPTSTPPTSTPPSSTPPSSTPPSTTSPTSTTSKTASLCTSTTTISPTPTCEYKCGSWCSNPLPPFSDNPSCNTAASNCAVQLASCFLGAGFPASLNCFEYAGWCSSISNYCSSYCPGNRCSLSGCKSKYPPSGPSSSPIVSSVVYTCSPTTTSTKPASSTTTKSSSTSCVPVPTQACMCTQPSNPGKGYTSSSSVGSIVLPCLTCNNLQSDYNSGNLFKLYTSPDSHSCPSYPQPSVPQGCKDACDSQHTACLNTYAEGCKSNSAYEIAHLGYDSYSSACAKCTNQWNDCYTANAGISHGNRCTSWNSGWY